MLARQGARVFRGVLGSGGEIDGNQQPFGMSQRRVVRIRPNGQNGDFGVPKNSFRNRSNNRLTEAFAAVSSQHNQVDMPCARALENAFCHIAFGHQHFVVLAACAGMLGGQFHFQLRQITAGSVTGGGEGLETGEHVLVSRQHVQNGGVRSVGEAQVHSCAQDFFSLVGEVSGDQYIANGNAGGVQLRGSHGLLPFSPRGGVLMERQAERQELRTLAVQACSSHSPLLSLL